MARAKGADWPPVCTYIWSQHVSSESARGRIHTYSNPPTKVVHIIVLPTSPHLPTPHISIPPITSQHLIQTPTQLHPIPSISRPQPISIPLINRHELLRSRVQESGVVVLEA